MRFVRPVHSALLFLLAWAAACGRRPAADAGNRPQFIRTYAWLSVYHGDTESQFALPRVAPIQWSQVGWIPVHHGRSTGMSAFTVGDSALAPVLFVAIRRPAPQAPSFSIRTMAVHVSTGDPKGEIEQADARYDPGPAQCRGESWITGFFIDGIGPRPTHPVVLRFESEGVMHRLRIDPGRNLLHGKEAFHLPISDVGGNESIPPSRSVYLQFDGSAPPMVAVFATRDARGWRGSGGIPSGRSYGWGAGFHELPVEESRLFLLGAMPDCQGDAKAPARPPLDSATIERLCEKPDSVRAGRAECVLRDQSPPVRPAPRPPPR